MRKTLELIARPGNTVAQDDSSFMTLLETVKEEEGSRSVLKKKPFSINIRKYKRYLGWCGGGLVVLLAAIWLFGGREPADDIERLPEESITAQQPQEQPA